MDTAALEIVSFGESAVADEGGGDGGEGCEVVGLAFVAAVEPAEASEPGHRPFDGPAVAAEAGGGLDAAAGDAVSNLAASQVGPDEAVVVGFVGMEFAGSPAPGAAAGPDRRDSLDERDQGLAVVEVGPGDRNRKGQTGTFGEQMDLRTVLAPIYRIRTCQIPFFRARMFTESTAQRDQSSLPRAPSSSRTRRYSLAHTRAAVHSVKRRCAVGPDGPKHGGS